MAKGEVRYIDRRDGELKTEAIYGERPLRWAYGNPLGRLAQWLLIRRWIVSAWYGSRMDTLSSSLKIKPFIEQYGLDEGEFAEPVDDFNSFNEFFFRKLKQSARPVNAVADSVVFPADGRHLAFADITAETNFFVKGQSFDLERFLGDAGLAKRYEGGSMILSRLCPVDYHRFHFPCAGKPGPPRFINGWHYSVNPSRWSQGRRFLGEQTGRHDDRVACAWPGAVRRDRGDDGRQHPANLRAGRDGGQGRRKRILCLRRLKRGGAVRERPDRDRHRPAEKHRQRP